MATGYEYSMMIQSFGVKPEIVNMTADQIGKDLAGVGARVGKGLNEGLPKIPPGDWQVASHSLTRIGGALVASFLLRRPKK